MSLEQEFGGCYVPEALYGPLQEVRKAFEEALESESFREKQRRLFRYRVGRPTALTHLAILSEEAGGAQIWAKREDLCQSGSFLGLSAFSQALLATEMGRTEIFGETGTGDFGVALGSAGAALGLKVKVFMKRDDMAASPFNVERMKKLGVEIVAAEGSYPGRRQAQAQALRYLAGSSNVAFYATSSLASPEPYPQILEDGLSLLGQEALEDLRERGVVPEYVVASMGTGSFALGLLKAFQGSSQLVGVQSHGDQGQTRGADSMGRGRPGVFLGTRSMVLSDEDGQVELTHTQATGLAMPAAGPQHARWLKAGIAHYATISDAQARAARRMLVKREGIFASLETGYGLAYALELARTGSPDEVILVGISGAGLGELGSDLLQNEESR